MKYPSFFQHYYQQLEQLVRNKLPIVSQKRKLLYLESNKNKTDYHTESDNGCARTIIIKLVEMETEMKK